MTMMFEVADLAVASPATVSRCGMVYLGTSVLGIWPLIECWIKTLPPLIKVYSEQLEKLFKNFFLVRFFKMIISLLGLISRVNDYRA